MAFTHPLILPHLLRIREAEPEEHKRRQVESLAVPGAQSLSGGPTSPAEDIPTAFPLLPARLLLHARVMPPNPIKRQVFAPFHQVLVPPSLEQGLLLFTLQQQ